MNDTETPVAGSDTPTPEVSETVAAPTPEAAPIDPVRAAAGRIGGKRFHQLAILGREYEREHRLTPGRQRLKQLVQLGRRYEEEHGLRVVPRKRKRSADAWTEFLTALSRVVKPKYQPAVEQLVASLRSAAA